MDKFVTRTIDLKSGSVDEKRSEILAYFEKTWEVDELLYSQLKSDEIFYHRGDPLRHILLFYLGHTAVFFINKLFLAKIIENRINPAFESIFAIGVDEMSWDDLNDKNYCWPKVSEVREYRNAAKKIILDVIQKSKLTLPICWDDPFWIILMGIEHERIHLETSSVLIRQLPLDEVVPGKFGEICNEVGDAPQNYLVDVNGGAITLGKPDDHRFYGWDNEYGVWKEEVKDFKASAFLVSNAEFLEFIIDGGYSNKNFWTEEGWSWCSYKKAEMPLFWRKVGDNYQLRLVAEEIQMPWSWPVEVNYLEAKAFCNWKSAKESKSFRLPTEAEWYMLIENSKVADVDSWTKAPGNINLEYYSSPCPVNAFAFGDFYDLQGNVWQWTETPITGFPGFKVHPMYDDFSTPTFDGKHNLIKGGSWISTGNEATLHARYAFRRHFYQHAGFRIVESDQPLLLHADEYEFDKEVALSCDNSWRLRENQAYFDKFIELSSKFVDLKQAKVLDLNADTGKLAFEFALQGANVTAIDFTARFIRMPIQLQEKGFMRYVVSDEGELVLYQDYVLDDKYKSVAENIQFMQDNANNLKPIYTGYDLIVLPQLLEELICPILFLKSINERLNKNGILIIASTYDWQAGGVDRKHWPGGFKRDGEPLTSFEGIKQLLTSNFELLEKPTHQKWLIKLNSNKSTVFDLEFSCWKRL